VLALLEPGLIVLVGAFVLLVVLSVLLPMMSMGQGLGM
jgi:type II secretory pathway component PulF